MLYMTFSLTDPFTGEFDGGGGAGRSEHLVACRPENISNDPLGELIVFNCEYSSAPARPPLHCCPAQSLSFERILCANVQGRQNHGGTESGLGISIKDANLTINAADGKPDSVEPDGGFPDLLTP